MLQVKLEQTGSWEPCRLPLCQQSAHEGSGNLDFLKAGERNCKGHSFERIDRKDSCKIYLCIWGFVRITVFFYRAQVYMPLKSK